MTITAISQFDSALKPSTNDGDTRYLIPPPADYDWRTFNFTSWLRGLSATEGLNFTEATFTGTDVLLVADKTNWDTGVGAAVPPGAEITSLVPAKSVAYSTTTFLEPDANNGTVTTTATITLVNDFFAGSNGEELPGAVVTNVPSGLTAVVTRTGAYTAVVSFTGAATAHAAGQSISNLTVTLGDDAFLGGDASAVTGATKADLVITFITVPDGVTRTITYDITTFTEAVANDGSITDVATITLAEDTFVGANDAPLTGAVVTNVPTGLTAVVTKKTSTTAELSFTGNAAAHESINSITDLTVTLGDTAFVGGDASTVTDATKADLAITFTDAI